MTERERLEAEKAKIQAQIDALPKVQTVKEEAQERFAVECMVLKLNSLTRAYRGGDYDEGPDMIAMVKIVQELRDMTAERDGLLAENAELKARGVASEPALVDPNLPLEAYHPDGRVVATEFTRISGHGAIIIARNTDVQYRSGVGRATHFKPTGEHAFSNSDWRIRNKAVQS